MDHGDLSAGLGPTRARVLGALEESGRALSAAELGRLLEIHPNSARFHLEALTTAGLVRRGREGRNAPGRPKVLYTVTPAARSGERRYQFLSEILTDLVQDAVPDAPAAAERVGRAWSRDRPRAKPIGTEDEALSTLVGELDEVGFVSRVVDEPESLRVEVSHCPFLEVAQGHNDVVCSLHLGMMRGVLDEVDAPLSVRELQPLVEPGLCLAHLDR